MFPFPYFLCFIAVIVLALRAWRGRTEGWGIPMGVVLATVTVWYLGESFHEEYLGYHEVFGAEHITNAWWEVLLFLIAFGMLVPIVNRRINGMLSSESSIFQMINDQAIDADWFQNQVTRIAFSLLVPWIILMLLALIRTDFDVVGIFFPYLGERADPWARGRMGGGIDALLSLAGYLQIMLVALFGVSLALSKRSGTMWLAGVIYFLSAPFFLLDRTRNVMLAVIIPGFLAYFSLRLRGGIVVKMLVAFVAFSAIQFWMKIVIASRGAQISVVQQLKIESQTNELSEVKKKVKHQGMNMFEELGYCNYFIANGTYKPNWGTRYFAELVNPIPRVIWPGKPAIGIDWAIAMGYGSRNASGSDAAGGGGIVASIATGMIGQGVVNFGRILGPIAAAFIMALWVAVLTRQDLMGKDIGHLLLYAIGLVLTFNMGRDITLLVLYPFVFGWILLTWINKRRKQRAS